MISADNLAVIASEGERILAFVRSHPDRRVPHYPSWTMLDLITHVAAIHARTAYVCRTLAPKATSPIDLPEGRDPCDWYAETLPAMIEALRELDPAAEGWTLFDDRRISTWERRMVVETGVHRWDAQEAVETPEPLLRSVATHGLEEFSDLWLPKLGDVPTLDIEAVDLARTWRFGVGEAAYRVAGSASDIFLRLMARGDLRLPDEWAVAVDGVPTPAGAA